MPSAKDRRKERIHLLEKISRQRCFMEVPSGMFSHYNRLCDLSNPFLATMNIRNIRGNAFRKFLN